MLLLGHCTGRIALWSGYLGGDPLHWDGTGGGSSQDGATDHGEETAATIQLNMGLPPAGGVHAYGGPVGDGDIYIQV